jgi:hypothetical protein
MEGAETTSGGHCLVNWGRVMRGENLVALACLIWTCSAGHFV